MTESTRGKTPWQKRGRPQKNEVDLKKRGGVGRGLEGGQAGPDRVAFHMCSPTARGPAPAASSSRKRTGSGEGRARQGPTGSHSTCAARGLGAHSTCAARAFGIPPPTCNYVNYMYFTCKLHVFPPLGSLPPRM